MLWIASCEEDTDAVGLPKSRRLDGSEEIARRSPEKIMEEMGALDAQSADVLGNIQGLL